MLEVATRSKRSITTESKQMPVKAKKAKLDEETGPIDGCFRRALMKGLQAEEKLNKTSKEPKTSSKGTNNNATIMLGVDQNNPLVSSAKSWIQ